MSPKKGVRSNRKSIEKLLSVRKDKPHLNTSANFKVSIPLPNKEEAGVHVPIIKGRRPPQFIRHLKNETKVELANSVARQQLVKEEPPVFHPDNVVFIKTNKRGKKRKVEVVSDFFKNRIVLDNTAEVASTDTILPEKNELGKKPRTVKKPAPTRRILTRKRLADSKGQEDGTLSKVESKIDNPNLDSIIKLEDNSHSVDEQVKPESDPLVKAQTTVVQKSSIVVQVPPTVTQPESKVVQPQPKKTKRTITRLPPTARKQQLKQQSKPGRKRGPKGKQQNAEGHIQTPSVADLLRKNVTESEVKTNHNLQNEPGLVESRKNSISSGSNKSWTRDISSSSNNTCIGSVGSNDFVRINKKLPILKLTNIDSEVKKRQNEAKEIAATTVVEETDDDLSDSYVSDSSDSERKFSEQLNDSLGANSLHLSASSSSRFTQSRGKESTSDNAIECSSDYEKAANKLSLTMEKLDLEIINWMNSENEDVNANLVKFRDKMFDILDREFGVITHCRNLKEMLNPSKKDADDDISFPDQVHECDANNERNNAQVEENAPVEENAAAEENTVVEENTPVEENIPTEKCTKELVKDFVEPRKRPSRHLSNTSEGNISISSTRVSKDGTSGDEMAAGTSNNYDHHDDDDTLSLFAESISGFEYSRINTSTASAVVSQPRRVEEYVPEPVNSYVQNIEKQTYCPTKIIEDPETTTSKILTVCEKQNADSTSIYKQSNSTDDAESYQDFTENIDFDTRLGPPDMIKKPRLMDSYFEGLPKARSVVFGKLCFYNLMNCCRKVLYGQCRFVHMIPTSAQIKDKLNFLDERMLIQEYLLLRNWSELRRRYGMCYVEECAKRGLTRILVEMAYDFIVKARNESEEDTRLRVDTIEVTLLHLNTVDLSICEDLLKLTIHSDQGNRTLLCDVFMATMSITQNFSRFKTVFLTLTYFMVDNDRTFNKDVVEHILERVCILPFEEPIARALIQMMRLTKSDIFNNSMIGHFENQISKNKDVFEEYTLLKNQCAFSSMLASSVMPASPPLKVDSQAAPSDGADSQPPAASPDTTNLDNMNKSTEEPSQPIITRTIGMNPQIIFNRAAISPGDSRAHVNPGSSKSYVSPGPSRAHADNSGSDTSDDTAQLNMRTWRNRSIFSHLPPPMVSRAPMRGTPTRGTPTRGTMRPPMRPLMRPSQRSPFIQRLVTFKNPSNYANRQPGPNY